MAFNSVEMALNSVKMACAVSRVRVTKGRTRTWRLVLDLVLVNSWSSIWCLITLIKASIFASKASSNLDSVKMAFKQRYNGIQIALKWR